MLGKVLVVEDDAFTRLSICASLQLQGMKTIEAESAASALAQARKHPVAAALIDLHLGQGPTGLDLALELRKLNRSVGLVFLSSFSSPKLLLPGAELPTGAVYLTKREVTDSEKLITALSQSLTGKAKTTLSSEGLGQLSREQLETLRFLAQGLSNAEIAKQRFVTERSVEKSISRIAKNLNLESQGGNLRVMLAKTYLRESGLSELT